MGQAHNRLRRQLQGYCGSPGLGWAFYSGHNVAHALHPTPVRFKPAGLGGGVRREQYWNRQAGGRLGPWGPATEAGSVGSPGASSPLSSVVTLWAARQGCRASSTGPHNCFMGAGIGSMGYVTPTGPPSFIAMGLQGRQWANRFNVSSCMFTKLFMSRRSFSYGSPAGRRKAPRQCGVTFVRRRLVNRQATSQNNAFRSTALPFGVRSNPPPR